ncbi:hypothetical protein [Streptomyces sp.]|uniref:hypothetical protein n=1 Tax=Streptomyces sp. TaxID=1931 RepID=UPI0034534740
MADRRRQPVGQCDARRLLTTGRVPSCPACRPDTARHIAGLSRPRSPACPRHGEPCAGDSVPGPHLLPMRTIVRRCLMEPFAA